MKPDLITFLGQRILVTVDRLLSSRRPRHADMIYPINYGFVPGTVSGDGMPVDPYLLGLDEAIEQAEGLVIAVIQRTDDVEDKLVVALNGEDYTAGEITEQVAFHEQYFDSGVIMSGGG